MRFKKRTSDEPSIDIIPMIDVLMAILIFLMLTTTFNKFTEMQLQLPTADTEAARDYPKEVSLPSRAKDATQSTSNRWTTIQPTALQRL